MVASLLVLEMISPPVGRGEDCLLRPPRQGPFLGKEKWGQSASPLGLPTIQAQIVPEEPSPASPVRDLVRPNESRV